MVVRTGPGKLDYSLYVIETDDRDELEETGPLRAHRIDVSDEPSFQASSQCRVRKHHQHKIYTRRRCIIIANRVL